MDDIRSDAVLFFQKIQNQICDKISQFDGQSYKQDLWTREGGGGGDTRIFSGGTFLEKGGVNFSEVHGKLSPEFAKTLPYGDGIDFFASGISLVLHPVNPYVPTVHANFRYIQRGDTSWFGGGADLTPYYVFEEDAKHFHSVYFESLSGVDKKLYPKFKKKCDEYFYLPHRNETRGIGGIFFDYLFTNEQNSFDIVKAAGSAFVSSYFPIVEKRIDHSYSTLEKEFQEYRRGRYVEFNLLYDRGTIFGLKTGGRIESILMSLPQKVRWEYNYSEKNDPNELNLVKYLKPRDWLGLENTK